MLDAVASLEEQGQLSEASTAVQGELPASSSSDACATVPDAFTCPITGETMTDPVRLSDGHSYERAAIAEWLTRKRTVAGGWSLTSPVTGVDLPEQTLLTDHTLRKAIDEWREKTFALLPRSALELQQPAIARGSFKTVYKATLTNGKNKLARQVAVLELRGASGAVLDFVAEAPLLVRLSRHPQLVQYIGPTHTHSGTRILTRARYPRPTCTRPRHLQPPRTAAHTQAGNRLTVQPCC